MVSDTKFLLWLLLLSSSSSCFASVDDVQCLMTVLESVIDTRGMLQSSWIFGDSTSSFTSICRFAGVECWQSEDNEVLALSLSNFGLEGQFPQGFENCTSMTSLDLSSNNFFGPLPTDIARQLSSLTFLDLSNNSFSGEIPAGISDLTFLNVLYLQHNQFSGQIPLQFSVLYGLYSFNVADNQLSGTIPPGLLPIYPPSNFTGNQGLCGAPLDNCSAPLYRICDNPSIGAAAGFVVGFVVAFYFPHVFVFSHRLHPYVVRIC